MKRLDLPGVQAPDRAYELDDGRRVLVRIRRRQLPASSSFALVTRAVELDDHGEVLHDAPCCPARTHTLLEASLAHGRISLDEIVERECALALERFQTHRAALDALSQIAEDDEE